MNRVIMLVLPTPWSPRKTILYLDSAWILGAPAAAAGGAAGSVDDDILFPTCEENLCKKLVEIALLSTTCRL